MKRFILACLAAAALPLSASAAELASLTVTVEGVSGNGGNLRVGLFDRQAFPVRGARPVNGRVLPAQAGEMTVLLEGIVPGDYAVKVLDDENADGKMNFTLGMIPAEPYGFSNDAKAAGGPPAWNDAKFTVKPGANSVTIHLH